MPRSTLIGSQSLPSSSSPKQNVYRAGVENVARSRKFGMARQTLRMTSRRARPMVALARQPGPKHPAVQLMSSAGRAGPFTMTTWAAPESVPVVLWQLPFSFRCARTAATTTGM